MFDSTKRATSASVISLAVREAIEAYKESGKMVDAALAYAARGVPIFPLSQSKRPIPKRDKDPTGKYKKGIPGTGGVYKATCDPLIIRKWWRKNPNALIGLPMGERTGVWCIDVDTSEDHADGVAEWNKIIAQYTIASICYDKHSGQRTYLETPPFTTREHRSATGGPHLLFNWYAERPIGCSSGDLPKGIEIKGTGGYIAVPPSQRKGRSYTVFRDIDPVDAPAWLIDRILPERAPYHGPPSGETDIDELADAMRFVPNDDLGWMYWNNTGMALFAATNGSDRGLELFDDWSKLSKQYGLQETPQQRWDAISGSPPDRTGANKLYKIARENGWVPELKEFVDPSKEIKAADNDNVTVKPPPGITADAAREQVRKVVREFLVVRVACPESERGVWTNFAYCSDRDPSEAVLALPSPTGIGKTAITIEELTRWLPTVKIGGPIIYAVPQHKLSPEIEQRFAEYGIDARIFRGRGAADPEHPGHAMCLNPKQVALATKVQADIMKTCCYKNKSKRCPFIDRCGYIRQQGDKDDPPDVWIVAADMLFHKQAAFGHPVGVIIDEAFWKKGIRGIAGEDETRWLVALDSLLSVDKTRIFDIANPIDRRDSSRHLLGETLRKQQLGGVDRDIIEARLDERDCDDAIKAEWNAMPQITIEPGMGDDEIKTLAGSDDLIWEIKHARRIIQVWQELRRLLHEPDIAVSGRLTLKKIEGRRVVKWRGIDHINKQFRAPTLLLDATLPSLPVLQVYHPQVKRLADMQVAMPEHVQIRQVLHAPVSSNKLQDEKHLAEIWRYILQRWYETGRQRTLVITQMFAEQWLLTKGLPDTITVEHFNNISGRDEYRDVRLLIVIGRTAPGPAAMEAVAAAMSGVAPIKAKPNLLGFTWYDTIKQGIKLTDGRVIATTCDQHPDPFVDQVRWLVHEAELIQAIGRARAINRTSADQKLDIDLLFDTALPIAVDKAMAWRTPSLLVETATTDGVMLTSLADLQKAWPTIWPNEKAAERTVKAGVPDLPGFEPVSYRLAGRGKMKERIGWLDRSRVPNPLMWLEDRLGPVLDEARPARRRRRVEKPG